MSGDETAGPAKSHPPVYDIVEASWQSLAMKTYLRTIDAMSREDWASPVQSRAVSGNPPRHRREVPNPKVEVTPVPIGLWRNCYDEQFLASLRPHELERLEIIDAEYDFTLTPATPVGRQTRARKGAKGKGRAQ